MLLIILLTCFIFVLKISTLTKRKHKVIAIILNILLGILFLSILLSLADLISLFI